MSAFIRVNEKIHWLIYKLTGGIKAPSRWVESNHSGLLQLVGTQLNQLLASHAQFWIILKNIIVKYEIKQRSRDSTFSICMETP